MADKPQSGEAELAIYLGSKIADSLVGATADRFITGPVLNLLGIKKTDNSAKDYHQDIVQRLSGLGQSLDDQVRDLQTNLNQIKSISTQIKDYLTQESLAQVLRDYNNSASTVETVFELFLDDVSALSDAVAAAVQANAAAAAAQTNAAGSTSQTNDPNDAVTDLYQNVLNFENAEKVSEAMSRIYDLLVKPTDFDKGIADYLKDMVTAEIQKFAETDDNFVHKFTRSFDTTFNVYLLDRKFQYYDCANIVTNGYDVAHAELPKIAALFQRIVATQLRGLLLLAKAWQESPHAPTLGLRVNEVLEGIQLMKNFYADYKTTVDTAVMDALKTSGKYLTDDFLHSFTQVKRDVFTWCNQTQPSDFLSHDWIVMRVEEASRDNTPQDRLWLVYQPWTDASKLAAGADRYFLATRLAWQDGSTSLTGIAYPPNFTQDDIELTGLRGSQAFDRFIYPGLNPLPSDAPSELASVVNGLPASLDTAVKDNLNNLLTSSSFRGVALSFKCNLDGADNVWLQGHPASGSLDLAAKRAAAGSASTAWRVFFTLMPPEQLSNTCLKCLGFDFGEREFLNGKMDAMRIELAADSNPEVSGGTEWMIRPWDGNLVSFVRVTQETETSTAGTAWLQGNADGSVSLTNFAEDSPGLKWSVYPYVIDN